MVGDRNEDPALAKIRILLVEDHIVLREGLRALLEINPELQIVGEAGSVGDALTLASELRPSIVLTDIALPDRSGISLVGELNLRGIASRVVMLTAHNGEEYVRAALEAGACGYILKEASSAELVLGIQTVAAGRRFLCHSISDLLVVHYMSPLDKRPAASPDKLTDREAEVLGRIARGESNKHIARALLLSVKTVEKHRSNMMRKLLLHNTAEVTLFAIRNGLISRI